MVERQLLSDLSMVYAGYFVSLTDQGKMEDALRAIERARGRVEVQALAHREVVVPGEQDAGQVRLTNLNVQLLNTDDPKARRDVLAAIYSTEQQLADDSSAMDVPPTPVPLSELQRDLQASELFVEYVLARSALLCARNHA
jgi:hypothetical protein